jgi:NagD protein
MDTDILAGVESEIQTALVLTGVTTRTDLPQFAYQPTFVLNGVGEIAQR